MRTVSSVVALLSLFLTLALLPVIGAALFAIVCFGLFLLALVGVLGGLEDRTVRQHDAPMSPTAWRNGS